MNIKEGRSIITRLVMIIKIDSENSKLVYFSDITERINPV